MAGVDKKEVEYVKPIPVDTLAPDVLKRYVKTRNKVDEEIEAIQAITRILALLKHYDEGEHLIDFNAVGQIAEILDRHATNIWEVLDDFISIAFAEHELAGS